MKHILLIISILLLNACGGGSGEKTDEINVPLADEESFSLQNVRFDSEDYYEGEQVTIIEGTSFEVQWVSSTSEAYRIDLYLSTNDAVHSDTNKIVGLKCGTATLSLCPNPTGEVQCQIEDNKLSCSIGSDPVGNASFQDKDLSSLNFIIKGCDTFSNCDVKKFGFLLQKNLNDTDVQE